MPLYEYECSECETRVEALQKMGEDGTALKCEKCAATGLRKVIKCGVVRTAGSGKSVCTLGGSAGGSGFT